MHCTRCGTLIPENARFCLGCGAPVGATSEPTVAQAVAQPGRLSDSGALELLSLLVEETKNDYEIHEEVGRGGMAVVYRATEIHLSRQVAIKVLPPELTFGKGAIERFRREARTAAALDHPNIIPIYRITPGGRLFWYAMKFLEGRSLGDVLQEKGLLTVPETIAILEQVADALDYAHQRNVVHRDIKPGNVMLDQRGRVIVTDFGIAKELQQGAALTGSGNILGTPYYMSPEQCRGSELTGAADQYSLAVMAYQMISGQLPFEADSAIDLLHKHCVESPPPIDSILPGLPKHVINALNRAMAKKAVERFPSTAAFVAGLKGQDSDEDTATIVLERRASLVERIGKLATGSIAKGKPNRKWAIAAGIGGLAIIGAVAGLGLNARSNRLERQRAALATAHADSVRRADSLRTADSLRLAAAAPKRTPGRTAARPAPSQTVAVVPQRTTADPQPAATGGRLGHLRITLTGGWADIYVNGVKRTEGISWADSVPSGRVSVQIQRPGWQTQTRVVQVRPGQPATALFTMKPGTP